VYPATCPSGVGLSHVAPRPPDHDGELALEVELVGDARAHQRLGVSEQGVGEAQEHARCRRDVAPGFLGMRAVIDADAHDALGSGTTGRNCRVDNARFGARPAGEPFDLVERVRCECLAQVRELSVGERRNVDNAFASHHPEARLAVGHITREFHCLRSLPNPRGT
jgi:hypothetical protein